MLNIPDTDEVNTLVLYPSIDILLSKRKKKKKKKGPTITQAPFLSFLKERQTGVRKKKGVCVA